ncbi:MAG: NAD(P)/FAD-dependent oxidoreductase [Methanosarcinaceae archaeon]|nr:NAD(P)/FAD-dependent oxidoreductase [Methanosarcinaceae archaeon]
MFDEKNEDCLENLNDGSLEKFADKGFNKLKSVTPHIPLGIVSPDELIKIAEIAKKYNAVLRITSSQTISLSGLSEDDRDLVRSELEFLNRKKRKRNSEEQFVLKSFQSVKTCRGKEFCRRGKQNALTLGLKIDNIFYGTNLPSKLRVAVSGCPFSCSEPIIRDIGIVGTNNGYNFFVGGNASTKPRFGILFKENLTENCVLEYINAIVNFLIKYNSKKRLGEIIDIIGLDEFEKEIQNEITK